MVEGKLAAAAALSLVVGLSAGTPAQAWCTTRTCSQVKDGQCVETQRFCYDEPGGGAGHRTTYGAIAYSPSSGSFGYSYEHANRTQAESRAVRECGKDDCKVATWFFNNCGAVAAASNGAWGGAQGGSERTAQSAALSRCANEGGTSCEIKVTRCSR
jgi:hypothetical protein